MKDGRKLKLKLPGVAPRVEPNATEERGAAESRRATTRGRCTTPTRPLTSRLARSGRQLTESRNTIASLRIPMVELDRWIGVAAKCSHGIQGAVVRASVAAVSTSRMATPPLLSAKL